MPARPVTRRRIVGAVLAALCLAGLGTGSAAQLTVTPTAVAAGTAVVVPCQATPIRVRLVTAWTSGAFRTTGVVLHGLSAACGGQRYRVTLVGTGSPLVEVTGTVPAAGGDITTPTFAAIPTTSIVRVEMVVHG